MNQMNRIPLKIEDVRPGDLLRAHEGGYGSCRRVLAVHIENYGSHVICDDGQIGAYCLSDYERLDSRWPSWKECDAAMPMKTIFTWKGSRYQRESEQGSRSNWRGHGGRRFTIRMLTGEAVHTSNLWYLGQTGEPNNCVMSVADYSGWDAPYPAALELPELPALHSEVA